VNGLSIHTVWRQQQLEFDESDKPDGNGMANWGRIWYAAENVPGMTRQADSDQNCRQGFARSGRLNNNIDNQFRQVTDRWPVFAFSRDLFKVEQAPVRTLFSIGLAQTYAIQFLGNGGLHRKESLWKSYWGDDSGVVSFVSCSGCTS
jgi:Domain of unknown function (DUF5127)